MSSPTQTTLPYQLRCRLHRLYYCFDYFCKLLIADCRLHRIFMFWFFLQEGESFSIIFKVEGFQLTNNTRQRSPFNFQFHFWHNCSSGNHRLLPRTVVLSGWARTTPTGSQPLTSNLFSRLQRTLPPDQATGGSGSFYSQNLNNFATNLYTTMVDE